MIARLAHETFGSVHVPAARMMRSAVALALIVLADTQRPSCNLNALVAPVNAACCLVASCNN